MPFYDYEAIKASTDILRVAEELGLTLRKSGAGFRSPCPACKSDDKRGLVITPGKGYYCFSKMKGGDVIALAAHILEVSDNQAAGWLTETYGTGTSTVQLQEQGQVTVPPKNEKREPTRQFDPQDYLSKLVYSEEVAALGISQEDAAALGIGSVSTGLHRGRIAIALRWPTGEIAGFGSVEGGTIKLPQKLIAPKVVALRRA